MILGGIFSSSDTIGNWVGVSVSAHALFAVHSIKKNTTRIIFIKSVPQKDISANFILPRMGTTFWGLSLRWFPRYKIYHFAHIPAIGTYSHHFKFPFAGRRGGTRQRDGLVVLTFHFNNYPLKNAPRGARMT